MFGTQTRTKWPRNIHRPTINSPCQLSLPDQEISMSPYNLTKSLKLKQNRLRPSFPRKSKGSVSKHSSNQLVKKGDTQLDANINICRFFKDSTPMDIIKSYTPRMQDYETTADRMFNMRRRLSPVKRIKEDKRVAMSVDAARQTAVQRTSFLNIQKLELIRIYSQSEKQVDTTKGEQSMQERYSLSPAKDSKQLRRSSKYMRGQQYIGQNVLELRKTLKDASASKWNNQKSRNKPFSIPFERYYYKDFIWKVAFSNGLLLNPVPEDTKLKVYVGRGNNSQLVRSLIRRRNWWVFTERWEEANLIWTQLKINGYFALQESVNHPLALKEPLSKDILSRNELNLSILNVNDVGVWDTYWRENRGIEQKLTEQMTKRNAYFKKLNLNLTQIPPKNLRIQNHLSQNFMIGNKKALLHTMRSYYDSINQNVFEYLPLSFHITQGFDDPEYSRFLGYYYAKKKQSKKEGTNNIWIVKPGELTNRGNGIIVCLTLEQIKSILKRGGKHFDGTTKTFILQQYIEKPMLYQRRKFDIRHYILVTSFNGRHKGYWFKRGYIRTSSSQYTLNHGQASVHLTNDAVQKNMPDYGRYEKGNKVSYEDFQTYLQKEYNGKYDFFGEIYPRMMKIATDAIRASAKSLNPHNLQSNFQIFGLDFMIDSQFKPWLIECNSNPCLQLSCPLLSLIIPSLIQNTLKICVDSLAGPPTDFTEKRPRFTENVLSTNQFQLVYDSVLEEKELGGDEAALSSLDVAELDKEEDEEFEDDGESLED